MEAAPPEDLAGLWGRVSSLRGLPAPSLYSYLLVGLSGPSTINWVVGARLSACKLDAPAAPVSLYGTGVLDSTYRCCLYLRYSGNTCVRSWLRALQGQYWQPVLPVLALCARFATSHNRHPQPYWQYLPMAAGLWGSCGAPGPILVPLPAASRAPLWFLRNRRHDTRALPKRKRLLQSLSSLGSCRPHGF